jgi:signal transduction histidine kinase
MWWSSSDLLPHSVCLALDPVLIWLHATSDAITAFSYFTIPAALFVFVAKRRDLEFRWMFILFGAFVMACGSTHLLGLITLWQPAYLTQGIAKAITAMVSIGTAISIWPLMYRALAWPSPDALKREIEERKRIEEQLRDLAASLETRVQERTAEAMAATERGGKHAEQAREAELLLAESEKRFRAAQDASLDAFAIYEPVKENHTTVDLRVLYANRNAARYCHTTPEAMMGRLISELLPGSIAPRGMIETFSKVADTGMPLDFILEYDTDGIRGAFQNIVVSFDGLIATTFRDVTASVEAKRALEQAKMAAENANEAKSRFLAAASHDLRQPLQALSLYLGVLAQRLPPENSSVMRYIDICVTSLNELLSDLLDLSKLEAGVVEPKQSDFPVSQILDKVVAGYAGAAREKGLRLRVVPSRLHASTDPVLFERIVTNLVSNALRYTRQGGTVIGCRHRAGRIWLEICDTGIGIPEDQQEVIFEEFRQLANPERSREKGSGLGLAIVRKTARLLGLDVRVSSQPGRGSTFAVELPLGPPNPPA